MQPADRQDVVQYRGAVPSHDYRTDIAFNLLPVTSSNAGSQDSVAKG